MSAITVSQTNVPSVVNEFRSLMLQGYECMRKACELYVTTIDKNPELRQVFAEQNPEVPQSTWTRFEAVGRGALHHKLLTAASTGARQLARCPYSVQSEYIDKPVEVVLNNGDVLKVELHALTPEQTKQVFAHDHIRTHGEQRAYLESLKTAAAVEKARKVEVHPWKVVRNTLLVGEVAFTRGQLLQILADMER